MNVSPTPHSRARGLACFGVSWALSTAQLWITVRGTGRRSSRRQRSAMASLSTTVALLLRHTQPIKLRQAAVIGPLAGSTPVRAAERGKRSWNRNT